MKNCKQKMWVKLGRILEFSFILLFALVLMSFTAGTTKDGIEVTQIYLNSNSSGLEDKQPEYPGGISAFYKFISENIKYPPMAFKKGVEGKVFVQFTIQANGKMSEVTVLRGIGAGCDKETIRVIKSSRKWAPGVRLGVTAPVTMVVPISFRLP